MEDRLGLERRIATMQEEKFDKWYHKEWMPHTRDSGGIVAQIKLLTWLVGALLTSQVALIGLVVTLAR